MTDLDHTPGASRTFVRYVTVLRRQWWVVTIVTLLALAAAAVYTETRRSVYSSSMKIVVGQGRALFGPDVSFAVQPFTQTMTDLLQSDVVARRTIEAERLRLTPKQLLDRTDVTSRPDTSVLEVSYQDTDPARATRTLGRIGSIFTQLVDTQLAGQPTRATNGQAASQPVSATVFDPAHADPGVVSPKPARTLAITLVLALVGGVALAFLRDALSSRIRTEQEAEDAFRAPVVGSLPTGALGITPAQLPLLPAKPGARIVESLDLLAATVRFAGGGRKESGVVLVTSSRPEDGKTTVAALLAATLARGGVTVAAMEADLRRPALHRYLGVEAERPGLSDVLAGEAALDEVMVPSPPAARGEPLSDADGRLLVLPAGLHRANPTQFLSLGRCAELLAQLRETADFVVIDSPPILLAGDAFPLAQLADTTLVISRQGVTSREDARAIRDVMGTLGVRGFSVVVTESAEVERRAYGYGYGYGAPYDEGRRESSSSARVRSPSGGRRP